MGTKAKTTALSPSKTTKLLGRYVRGWIISPQMPGHWQNVSGYCIQQLAGGTAFLVNLGTGAESCVWVARDQILDVVEAM